MARYRRANADGACYFFTVVMERRQGILTEPDMRAALHDAITTVRAKHPFQIDGWVLLPDHLHAIWTLPPGDADFPTRWRLIKSHVTRICGPRYFRQEWLTAHRASKHCGTLWQHRYWEHQIRDEADFCHHLDYLHFNPVKHGLVKSVAGWPYSSFHRWVSSGIYPPDWANTD